MKRAMGEIVSLIAAWRKEKDSQGGLRSCGFVSEKPQATRLRAKEITLLFRAPPADFFTAIAFQMTKTYQSSISVLTDSSEAFRTDVAEVQRIFSELGLDDESKFAQLI